MVDNSVWPDIFSDPLANKKKTGLESSRPNKFALCWLRSFDLNIDLRFLVLPEPSPSYFYSNIAAFDLYIKNLFETCH